MEDLGLALAAQLLQEESIIHHPPLPGLDDVDNGWRY